MVPSGRGKLDVGSADSAPGVPHDADPARVATNRPDAKWTDKDKIVGASPIFSALLGSQATLQVVTLFLKSVLIGLYWLLQGYLHS
jgi:hypothetical protein